MEENKDRFDNGYQKAYEHIKQARYFLSDEIANDLKNGGILVPEQEFSLVKNLYNIEEKLGRMKHSIDQALETINK